MNGKVAKKIRKLVYGIDYSPRFRKYSAIGQQIIADPTRHMYQQTKKNYTKGM